MKTLCLFLISALSITAQARTSIPETTPQDNLYKSLQDTVRQADEDDEKRFLDIKFGNLTGSLCYSLNAANGKNVVDSILVLNGKYFYVPSQLSSPDNFHHFYKDDGKTGNRPGIYMVQTGFRVDLELDRLARVVAKMRIADNNENILPALEYSEVVTQAQTRNYLETHPREVYTHFHQEPQFKIFRGSDFRIGEVPWLGEDKVKRGLMWAEQDPKYWYVGFTFAGVTARLAVEGNYILKPNSSLMYTDLNGKLFTIPYDFYSVDNWVSLTRERNGIYMTHRGFRKDEKTGALSRVIAKIRIAEPNGDVLSWLEYHEDVTPAKVDGAETLIERSLRYF